MPPTAIAPKRKKPQQEPTIPYCCWKLPVSTYEELRREAEERGASIAGLVRKVLGDWVKAQQKKNGG